MTTTVLMVDDNQEIIETTRFMLSFGDYNLIAISDFENAVDLKNQVIAAVTANHVDAVWADRSVGIEEHGDDVTYEALREVAKAQSKPQIPMITVSADRMDKKVIEQGLRYALQKPFGMDELFDIIDQAVADNRQLFNR